MNEVEGNISLRKRSFDRRPHLICSIGDRIDLSNKTQEEFLLDTGATCSLLNEKVLSSIKQGKEQIYKKKGPLTAVNGSNIKSIGMITLNLGIKDRSNPQELYVIEKGKSILGCDVIDKFEIDVNEGMAEARIYLYITEGLEN